VVGYTGVIRSAGGVPGRSGRFRLRVRVIRTDGRTDFALPPTILVECPTPTTPGPIYREDIIRFPGKNFCEFAIQGTLGRPITSPARLGVSLYETHMVPAWRQWITTLSTRPTSEISARTSLGVIVVPPTTVTRRPSGRSTSSASHQRHDRERERG